MLAEVDVVVVALAIRGARLKLVLGVEKYMLARGASEYGRVITRLNTVLTTLQQALKLVEFASVLTLVPWLWRNRRCCATWLLLELGDAPVQASVVEEVVSGE